MQKVQDLFICHVILLNIGSILSLK